MFSLQKPTNYIWSTVNTESETNNNITLNGESTSQIAITNTPLEDSAAATPPTPPPDSQLNLEQTTKSTYHSHNSLKPLEVGTQLIPIPSEEQEGQIQEHSRSGVRGQTASTCGNLHKANKTKHSTESHHGHSNHHHLNTHHSQSAPGPPPPPSHHSNNSSTMPIGGVQGQNPTQGLVHWMSAVMAEHMTGQTHHDPTAVGMHYMWNGNVDVSTILKQLQRYFKFTEAKFVPDVFKYFGVTKVQVSFVIPFAFITFPFAQRKFSLFLILS